MDSTISVKKAKTNAMVVEIVDNTFFYALLRWEGPNGAKMQMTRT